MYPQAFLLLFTVLVLLGPSNAFQPFSVPISRKVSYSANQNQLGQSIRTRSNVVERGLQMNFFSDAVRFFGNLNKEASAKHILIKGDDADSKLAIIKQELQDAPNVAVAFSEIAAKVSQCPSASRGGNLGTFKPGMMVPEFDRVCFEAEVGKVHGPIRTQFGSHLILITRRFDGEKEVKS